MERLARGGGVFTSLHQRMLSLLSTAIIAKAKVSAARDEPTVALSDADGLPDGLPSGAQARAAGTERVGSWEAGVWGTSSGRGRGPGTRPHAGQHYGWATARHIRCENPLGRPQSRRRFEA